MAPKKSDTGSRPNRVRFVLLEADLSDNNFADLASAITHALRPSTAGQQRTLPQVSRIPTTLIGSQIEDPESTEDVIEDQPDTDLGDDQPTPKGTKTARPKVKYPVPEFRHDLDMVGKSVSFKDFATQHAPKSTAKRYLVASMWMKEYGSKPTVDIHAIYSCYKTAGWPLGVKDWDQGFRSLVHADSMRRVDSGEYAITHLGEAALQKAAG